MANLTKIILGLNIAAGAAGLFFGLSVIPGKVDTLSESKTEEKGKADNATKKLTKLEEDRKNALALASQANSKADRLDVDKKAAVKGKDEAEANVSTLKNQNKTLEAEKQSWKTERVTLQAKATEAETAKTKLAAAKIEIADLTDEIERLKNPDGPDGPEIPPVKGGGKIANVDPRNGAIFLNRGSDHGFKVGDQFNVFRNNKLIGRVEVTRLSGANTGLSVAQRAEGLGVPAGAQFKENDDLVKFQ